MLRVCAKCNHANPNAMGAETDACPACGAIYAKAQAATARPTSAPAAGRSTATRRKDVPFIERLRAQSHYPAFRTVVGASALLGYAVAALALLGAIIVGVRGGGNAGVVIGGVVFACVIGVISKVAKEASLMLADLSDAMVRMASMQEDASDTR